MAATVKKRKTETEDQAVKQEFSKEQVVSSARYRDSRDLVEALLDNGKKYTFETVDNLIKKYRKGQVK